MSTLSPQDQEALQDMNDEIQSDIDIYGSSDLGDDDVRDLEKELKTRPATSEDEAWLRAELKAAEKALSEAEARCEGEDVTTEEEQHRNRCQRRVDRIKDLLDEYF